MPLLDYIDRFAVDHLGVTVLDRIMGNAAALLSIKAGCQEVGSPLGSQLAIGTLERYGIKYHVNKIVPYIKQPDSAEMWAVSHNWWKFDLAISYTLLPSQSTRLSNQYFL